TTGEIHRRDLPTDVLRSVYAAKPADDRTASAAVQSKAEKLFDQIVNGGESFWSAAYAPFVAHDLTRDDLRSLVQLGLERTSGSYRVLVELFNMQPQDYKRFLGMLRKYQCRMPFHQFRLAGPIR